MSMKEPAIRMLKERYSESFALTVGPQKKQIHLFLIKLGLWSLVWTFASKNNNTTLVSDGKEATFGIDEALLIIESAMKGENQEMQRKLDDSVSRALERMKSKLNQIK